MMKKGKIPYLGFESFWRPTEQKVVEIVVIVSHALTLAFGLASILWEKFFSSEVRRLRSLQKKNANERKQRMVKFSRARKNLMAGLRSQLALKKGGMKNAFGPPKAGGGSNGPEPPKPKGGLAGMNFAWPDQGANKKEDSSSSESEVDLDHWSSSEGSESGTGDSSHVESEGSHSAGTGHESTSGTGTGTDSVSGSASGSVSGSASGSASESESASSSEEETGKGKKEKVTADFNWD
jgi:hypothetical protein